jgi:hypothetical protein
MHASNKAVANLYAPAIAALHFVTNSHKSSTAAHGLFGDHLNRYARR